MTKSWVSGDRSSEGIEKLRQQVSRLESQREELVDKSKRKIFEWSWYVLNSPRAPKTLDDLRNSDAATQEVKEVIALYEQLNQEILDKEASLNEKLDEQARYDSLG